VDIIIDKDINTTQSETVIFVEIRNTNV